MQRVRSVFISDVHLGCKYGNADAFLHFLQGVRPDYLYIVGDFLDGWRLRKSWYWDDTYSYILKRMIELMRGGTQVMYTPGNHDEFLRKFIYNLGNVQISDEFVHITADDQRVLVMHGDQFDTVVRHARWLSSIGDSGYNFLLWLNRIFNAGRQRLGFSYWSLSAYLKKKVKQATSFVSNFESIVTEYARSKGCAGVVCGHIHSPKKHELNGVKYFNTGDWVESCTALIEHFDGEFEIVHRPLHRGAGQKLRGPFEAIRETSPGMENRHVPAADLEDVLDDMPGHWRDLEEVLS